MSRLSHAGFEGGYLQPDRRSISCTSSCNGCSSPECGYCDAKREALIERRLAAVYEGDSDELIAAMRSDEVLAVIVQEIAKELRDRLSFAKGEFLFKSSAEDFHLVTAMRSYAIRLTAAVESAVSDAVNEGKDWSRGFDRRAA